MSELLAVVEARASADGVAWLRESSVAVGRDAAVIRSRFPAVGRKLGRGLLRAGGDPEDVHAWTLEDAGRTLLLVALGERVGEEVEDLYRFGDAAERRGLLRALPFLGLDGDPRAVALVEDAIRSNDVRLIAAALGPFATAQLSDAAYDHAVLKCVFVGVPIAALDGVPARVTADGARMLAAFVHERVAAGRDVPAEVWQVIDKYPPQDELAAIEAELQSPFEDRRRAAARALSARPKTGGLV